MALTESNSFENGTLAPQFSLQDVVTGKLVNLHELKGDKGTVIMFICNHCPFVVHVNTQLVKVANYYMSKGIGFVAISSNDADSYPQDRPELMKQVATNLKYPFPYLYDETQEVAKTYDAACTPDFYVFDANLKATYHGQLDNSRPGNGIAVTGDALRKAIDAVLNNEAPLENQKPSIGCNIKWK
ncbi:thioredoxin family protein [uncultured Lacinutrix sp.]|uniref:thioredoxin family protein n=1 Tax=uncultured Lacinutrix sp. TaxID=574032 RepID=UPI00263360EE|nr:thioredoxin family protein [uncultured Lacinutrix sp.]